MACSGSGIRELAWWSSITTATSGGNAGIMDPRSVERRVPDLVLRASRAEERLPWPAAVIVIAALAAVIWGGLALMIGLLLT
jgi:hypothetical protein